MNSGQGLAVRGEPRELGMTLERHLAAAQEITHIGSWEWDLPTNTVRWSDELYRIYGLEPRSCEITFETFLAKLHPEDRERVQASVREALSRGGRFSYVERIFRPDGSLRYLDTVGEVVVDAAGKSVGLIGTCRDVTEARRREEIIQLYVSIGKNVQIGLAVWRVPDPERPQESTLRTFNPALERASGVALEARLGETLEQIFPGVQELAALLSRVARDGSVHEIPVLELPGVEGRLFSAKAFPVPGASVGIALEDVTQQIRARRLLTAEQRVLELIASGEGLAGICRTLVLAIEQQAPSTIASILLLDVDGTRLRTAAAPNLPETYVAMIDGEAIGPDAGSCGTAAFTGKPVFVSDIATDPLWARYRDAALEHGLRACWSTPVLAADGRVLGTFALYYRQPRSPDTDELALITRATRLAGIAIQRVHQDEQMRALSAHIEAVREEERTAIAREIHDELGQALTALKMDLAWLGRRSDRVSPELRGAIVEKLESMSQMTDQIIDQVRRISSDLRPGVLDDLGLVAAIEWQAQEFERRTGVPCLVRSTVSETRFERGLATALFRILQEALTNVTRHAAAGRVEVLLAERGGQLRLEVQDDGKGMDPAQSARRSSLGLLGMRERARQLGGSAVITGTPGRGTLVVVEVPMNGRRSP